MQQRLNSKQDLFSGNGLLFSFIYHWLVFCFQKIVGSFTVRYLLLSHLDIHGLPFSYFKFIFSISKFLFNRINHLGTKVFENKCWTENYLDEFWKS